MVNWNQLQNVPAQVLYIDSTTLRRCHGSRDSAAWWDFTWNQVQFCPFAIAAYFSLVLSARMICVDEITWASWFTLVLSAETRWPVTSSSIQANWCKKDLHSLHILPKFYNQINQSTVLCSLDSFGLMFRMCAQATTPDNKPKPQCSQPADRVDRIVSWESWLGPASWIQLDPVGRFGQMLAVTLCVCPCSRHWKVHWLTHDHNLNSSNGL